MAITCPRTYVGSTRKRYGGVVHDAESRIVCPPGSEAGERKEVEDFLRGGLPLAQQEPATVSWFAVRIGKSTFAIFDTFPDDKGRQAHLTGPIAKALMAKASDLLAKAPSIEHADVLAAKP